MEEDETNLEILLAKAANPLNKELDTVAVSAFCSQLTIEEDGPQTALRFLAHRIQSPQEKEAFMALLVLEECVDKCGPKFLNEVGKFRFLNELIKVVSPKYLGVKAPPRVKEKVLELLYKWSVELRHEAKIREAYEMLKKQGVVKEDPVHILKNYEPAEPVAPRASNTVFDDKENSQILQKLLQSRNPQDLQAANRLIKNMVKEADRRMELMARTATELETVHNNANVLSDMLRNYRPLQTSEEEKELMKELYDSCERLRPKLFRLAGELDEKDKGLEEILKSNDELTAVITLYRKTLGIETNDISMSQEQTLMDLNSPVQQTNNTDSSLLDDQLLNLGLNDLDLTTAVPTVGKSSTNSSLNDLGTIFNSPGISLPSLVTTTTNLMGSGIVTSMATYRGQLQPLQPSQAAPAKSSVTPTNSEPAKPASNPATRGFEELDVLGQTLLKQSLLPNAPKMEFPSTPQKVPMSQMQKQTSVVPGSPSFGRTADLTAAIDVFASSSPSKSSDAFSLIDVFVPLESIQPGTLLPLTLHEKNGLTVVVHYGRDSPRPDISVMVVSSMSKNSSPLKNVKFQAAVPKSMKIKLQPPSATDLPPHNPILPPAAITQVMLLANPSQEKVRLKYRITYNIGEIGHTDIGEVDNLLGGGT